MGNALIVLVVIFVVVRLVWKSAPTEHHRICGGGIMGSNRKLGPNPPPEFGED